MIHRVDTVVIGGGPAGMSCAITLQKNKRSNLVVEKKSFPRDKTCGGLVTNKTVRLLSTKLNASESFDLSDVLCDSGNLVEMYYQNTLLTRSTVSKKFSFVKREVFDSYLARQYTSLGGNLLENCSCASMDLPNHKILLTNNDTVEFQHLIVADGALSSTRKALGYQSPKLGFCIETHVPKSKLPYHGEIKIYFGIVKKGYAWIFPSGDEVCIGLGGIYQKGIKYDHLLKQFLASLHLDAQAYPLKGAFVPYGNAMKQNHRSDDVILVGDAGGFVDPIYGEGLYFAIASGIEAANTILSNEAKIRPAFMKRTSSFVKTIHQGHVLQKIFFQAGVLKVFQKVVLHKNRFVGFYCDHQVSEYTYSYAKLWKLYRDYKRRKNNLDL